MKKKKQIVSIFQLQLPCNVAKSDAVLGPTFGQYGVKAMEFCKKFNEYTTSNNYITGLVVKIIVTIYKDRSFDFLLKTPPLFFLFSQLSEDNLISIRDLYKVILIKKLDIFYLSLPIMYKNIAHTLIKNYKYEIK
jgi:large subunit ribosomal protein L11